MKEFVIAPVLSCDAAPVRRSERMCLPGNTRTSMQGSQRFEQESSRRVLPAR